MVSQTPAQEVAAKISSVQGKIGIMQSDVRMSGIRDTVEDVQSTMLALTTRISDLRIRGYVFEKNLEIDAKSLLDTWLILYPSILTQINAQSNMLLAALRPIEMQMHQVISLSTNPIALRNPLNVLESSVDQLESKIKAATGMIKGMFDKINGQLSSFTRHLNEIDFLLKNITEATFKLLPTESGIMAVKAIWCRSGKEQKDDPEGVLFLTDQRIIFEQKEDIATKKVLFFATEKKKIQVLHVDSPIVYVSKATAEKTGMLRKDDQLIIDFTSAAPYQTTQFHIWQDGVVWQRLINRARSKDFENSRAVALDQAVVEKVKSAPTQCPSCGGAITKPVLRGQDTIKCDYCGYEIRL